MNNLIQLYHGDNLKILSSFEDESFSLIYSDPPYGCGKSFKSRNGSFDDKLTGQAFLDWLKPRIEESKRLLTKTGSFFIHMDYHEIHYVKVLCDKVFGRESFMNEIIWQYDFGARQKTKWSTKHDNILWYAKDAKNYVFNLEQVDLIPKLAPGLPVSKNRKNPDKKLLTDVWWNTIVPTNGKERTGYPTQKPLAIVERIVKVHSNAGDNLLDPFAGSGTLGEAAAKHERKVTLIDSNIEAIEVMKRRLKSYGVIQKQVSD